MLPKIYETNMMYAMSLEQILVRGGSGKFETNASLGFLKLI